MIADAIPREYERKKDWGRTKEITTGLRSSGNFFKFDIHRTKCTVNDGVWKHYRATLVEPEKNLLVRIENLRSLEAGKIAFTLFVSTKLHGWGRAKVYESGVHLIALEAEADATVSLWLDCEIALETTPASFLTGVAVRPHVTKARMSLDEFRLTRISDVSGPVVRELGDGIKGLIQDELKGPKLAAKLNHSIDKRRDKLGLHARHAARRPNERQVGRQLTSGPLRRHRRFDGDELFLGQRHVANPQSEFVAHFDDFSRRDWLIADHKF